jgi:rhodanese-related sulfurtransferase
MFAPQVPSVHATDLDPAAPVPAGTLLLDVREQDEWDAGHAPQAVHIPLGELPDRVGELDPDAPLVVVCHSGARSARATAWLTQGGYDAVNLDGGMIAWARAGLPVV